MRRITLNILDPSSYNAVIKEIEAYKKESRKKVDELCRRVAEFGLSVASVHFIPDSGNSDVELSVEPAPGGYVLKASGEDVCFMEFGAGVSAGEGYDTNVLTPPVDITPGSWSSSEQGTKEFATYGSWHHKKVKYTGLAPKMGMYHAAKEMAKQVETIAKEVFRD